MILVSISDFSGFQRLSTNAFDTSLLQAYIDRYEKELIMKLLGAELGQLFIDDLANVSQDPRFVAIQDEFYIDYDDKIHHSRGLVDMLVSMIYYCYTKDTSVRHTTTGAAKVALEGRTNKQDVDQSRFGEKKWNDAVLTAEEIQWYITIYAPDTFTISDPDMLYPEYNGQKYTAAFSAIL